MSALLAIILIVQFRSVRHAPNIYWLAVMLISIFGTLGTAVGDLTAVTVHLGYFLSALLIAVVIAIPAIGFLRFRWNAVLAFWFAHVVTRPLGASVADWLGKPVAGHIP